MCPLSWTLDDITANGLNSTISCAKYQNEMANFRQQIEETIEAHPTRSRWTSERKAAEEWKNAAEKAELKNDAFPVVDWAASRTLRQFLQGHK
jgi:hypothetical protein